MTLNSPLDQNRGAGMEYFSDTERGRKAQIETQMSPEVWAGVVAYIQSLISTGAFGEHFPEICSDGSAPIGTDEKTFSRMLITEVPDIEWPLKTKTEQEDYSCEEEPYVPDMHVALDLIQFCYLHVSKPNQGEYHDFFTHYHLSFEPELGRLEFKETII